MPHRTRLTTLCCFLAGCAGDNTGGSSRPIDRGFFPADRVTSAADRWYPNRNDAGSDRSDGATAPDRSPAQDSAPGTEAGCQPACTGKCAGAASGCAGVVCPPAPCGGCCDGELLCRAGDTGQACGSGGVACTDCGSSQICQNYKCCNDSCNGKCGGQLNACGNPCNAACPDPCAGKVCGDYSHCVGGTCVCDYLKCGTSNCCAQNVTSCAANGTCELPPPPPPPCKAAGEECTKTPTNNCCALACCDCSSRPGCSGVLICQMPGISCNNTCVSLCG